MAAAAARVNEIPVAIGELDGKVRSQANLAGRLYQGAGWGVLTLAVLDSVGNIVGVPILTGAIATSAPNGAGIFLALILQLALFGGALALLYRSSLRLWVMDESFNPQAESEVLFKQRVIKSAAQISNFITPFRSSMEIRLSGMNKVLRIAVLVGLVAVSAIALFYTLHIAVILIVLTLAYAIEGDALLKTVHAVGPRIRDEEDSISKIGIVAGAVLSLLLFLLIGLQGRQFTPYFYHALFAGDIYVLQVADVVLLGFLVFLVQLAAKRSLEQADYYLVTSGGMAGQAARSTVHSFDFSSQQTVPVFARFDEGSLPAIVVVSQNGYGAYEIANPRRFLALHHRKIHVLDMGQFSAALPKNIAFRDSFGYFVGSFGFGAIARSTAALPDDLLADIQTGAPEQAVSILMTDLFMNPSCAELLKRLGNESIDRYLGQRRNIRDMMEFLNSIDIDRLRHSGVTPGAFGPSAVASSFDILRIGEQLLAHARVADSYTSLQVRISETWFPWREKVGHAVTEIPVIFKAVLVNYFLDIFKKRGGSYDLRVIERWIEAMFTCCEIAMSINSFELEANDATAVNNRLLEYHQLAKKESDQYTQRANAMLTQLGDALNRGLQMEHETKMGLIGILPGIMPYLMSSPLGHDIVAKLTTHGIQMPPNEGTNNSPQLGGSAPPFVEQPASPVERGGDRIRM